MISRKERHAIRKARRQQRIKQLATIIGFSIVVVIAAALLIHAWQELASPSADTGTHDSSNQVDVPNLTDQDHAGNIGTGNADEATDADGIGNDRNISSNEKPDIQAPREHDQSQGNDQPIKETTVSLAFAGDTMMAGNVARLVQEHGYDYPFQHVKEWLSTPDFTVVNLETPITERGEPEDKQYVYRTSPDALPAMLDAGIDVVSIANNHILDYGHIGFYDTLDYLEEAELAYVGGGRNIDEALEPVLLEKDGIKIAVLGFSRVVPEGWWKAGDDQPGVAETYDYTKPIEAIENAANSADLVVVVAHWGKEREAQPEPVQTELAHRYIDAGADLVIGSHPHVLQGAEHYKGKWIFYSLGNFIFTTNPNHSATWESVILNANCTKEGTCDLQVIPIDNKWAQPKPLDGSEGARVLQRLSEISINASVNEDGTIVSDS